MGIAASLLPVKKLRQDIPAPPHRTVERSLAKARPAIPNRAAFHEVLVSRCVIRSSAENAAVDQGPAPVSLDRECLNFCV